MGIKGLKALIKRYAPDAMVSIDAKSLKGKKIAIDSSILLYKFRYLINTDNFHILGFLNKVIEFLDLGIVPVFVFDGKPPDAKKETLDKRVNNRKEMSERLKVLQRELKELNEPEDEYFISSDNEANEETENVRVQKIKSEIKKLKKNNLYIYKKHSTDVMELLDSIGMPYFHRSEGEAEEMCAFLQKNGYVDYILSEDTDTLTFGGNNVLFTNKNGYTLCRLDTILERLDLSYASFIDLCILCGCDYTSTIPKVGPITALKMIKEHISIDAFPVNTESCDYQLARSIFTKNELFEKPELDFTVGKLENVEAVKEILTKNNIFSFELNKLIRI
jgi:flap endonuclease-1